MNHLARVIEIQNLTEAERELLKVGVYPDSLPIMAPKGVHRAIKLKDIPTVAANIIKQEMLSKGGEAALSSGAVDLSKPKTDVLIFGTAQEIKEALEKFKLQPFGLKEIASEIETILKNYQENPPPIKAGYLTLDFGQWTYMMGVLNVTPDSFSDGGKFIKVEDAVAHAKKMIEEGADIIDIGGESTRPGAQVISIEEELSRVIPVIKKLSAETKACLSIDTRKAPVAKEALEAGVHLVNDISGLHYDREMGKIIKKFAVPVIIMHIQGDPQTMQVSPHYEDLIPEIMAYLKEGIEIAESAGVLREKIIIDPGIGFGKTLEHNFEILRRLREFRALGRPISIGTSRKSMIGKVLDLPVEERLEGTAATVALAIANGADIIRVHDVREMGRVAKMTDAIVRKW